MSLVLNDLAVVLDELHDVRKMWYEIGLRLQLPVEDLEIISSEHKNDQQSLRRVILLWLKSGTATWAKLCDALSNRTVGEMTLADKLRGRYSGKGTTGESYLIVHDMYVIVQYYYSYRGRPSHSFTYNIYVDSSQTVLEHYRSIAPCMHSLHVPTMQDQRRGILQRKHKVSHVHKKFPKVAPVDRTLSRSAAGNCRTSQSTNLLRLTVLTMT